MDNAHDFYRDPRVIQRILEYCGVPESAVKDFSHEPDVRELAGSGRITSLAKKMSSEYVAGVGDWVKGWKHKSKATSRRPEGLGELLDHDLNLFRSVWDRKSIVFFMDVEYTSGRYPGAEPLVDVPLWYYDSLFKKGTMDFGHLIYCMWHPEAAIEYAQSFTGFIPCANEGLIGLVEENKRSNLFQHHQEMDRTPQLARQEAFQRAVGDQRLTEKTHSTLRYPNPRVMDPKSLVKLIGDLKENGWSPAHIGNVIADLYEQPQHRWNADWFKYSSRTRGNFWARIYTGPEQL